MRCTFSEESICSNSLIQDTGIYLYRDPESHAFGVFLEFPSLRFDGKFLSMSLFHSAGLLPFFFFLRPPPPVFLEPFDNVKIHLKLHIRALDIIGFGGYLHGGAIRRLAG